MAEMFHLKERLESECQQIRDVLECYSRMQESVERLQYYTRKCAVLSDMGVQERPMAEEGLSQIMKDCSDAEKFIFGQIDELREIIEKLEEKIKELNSRTEPMKM